MMCKKELEREGLRRERKEGDLAEVLKVMILVLTMV